MRSKTSVRQPIIAGTRRGHLSEMLRKWRRQPRKRSLLLFWALLSLALLSDTFLLVLGARLVGVCRDGSPPPAERHIHVPFAADAALWEPLRRWVVRAEGRTQLFESFSRAAVPAITGEERFEGSDPLAVVVSWMLDREADALKWEDYPFLPCEDAELRAVLYPEDHSPARMSRQEQLYGRYVEPSVVRSSRRFRQLLDAIRDRAGAGESVPLTAVERHAVELRDRLARFDAIRNGGVEGGDSAEMQTASAALCDAYQRNEKDLFAAALNDFLGASRRALRAAEDRALACEDWINEHAPARKAMYLSLLGAGLFTAAALLRTRRPRWRRRFLLSGLLACLGGLGWTIAAIVCGAIRDGAAVSDGTLALLWVAGLILGLGLGLAVLRRDAFLAWTGSLAAGGGFLLVNYGPQVLREHWSFLPEGAAESSGWGVQGLLLLSALAPLTLAWGVAALTLGRILAAPPNGERVRRLSALCLELVRMGMVPLTAAALLDGWLALMLGSCWRGGNAQAAGTLVILPSCAALIYARRRGWIHSFTFLAGVGLAFTVLAGMGHLAIGREIGKPALAPLLAGAGWLCAAGLLNLSLTAHATLRFYFGKQPILET